MGTFLSTFLEAKDVVNQIIKVTNSINIISDKLYRYIYFVLPNGDGFFKQDNAPFDKT